MQPEERDWLITVRSQGEINGRTYLKNLARILSVGGDEGHVRNYVQKILHENWGEFRKVN